MPTCVIAFSCRAYCRSVCLRLCMHFLRDLVSVVRFSIRPADLEEADDAPPHPHPHPFNISSQHSCPLQLSRVHPGEDECAVSMLVENTLYKRCTGPCSVCVLFCLFGPFREQCASITWIHLGPVSEGHPASLWLSGCPLNVCVRVCWAPCVSLQTPQCGFYVFFYVLFPCSDLFFPISLSALVWWIKS